MYIFVSIKRGLVTRLDHTVTNFFQIGLNSLFHQTVLVNAHINTPLHHIYAYIPPPYIHKYINQPHGA